MAYCRLRDIKVFGHNIIFFPQGTTFSYYDYVGIAEFGFSTPFSIKGIVRLAAKHIGPTLHKHILRIVFSRSFP